MKLAFLVDPLGDLKPKKDSSIAMMREASRRGHEIYAFELPDLRVRGRRGGRAGPSALPSTATTRPGIASRLPRKCPSSFSTR